MKANTLIGYNYEFCCKIVRKNYLHSESFNSSSLSSISADFSTVSISTWLYSSSFVLSVVFVSAQSSFVEFSWSCRVASSLTVGTVDVSVKIMYDIFKVNYNYLLTYYIVWFLTTIGGSIFFNWSLLFGFTFVLCK